MGNLKYRYIILLSLFMGLIFSACNKNWDNHDAVTDPILTVNLLTQINKNPDLSTFSSYLVKTGYDKVVASSKTFTIWAPTNAALAKLDQSYVTDTAKLKQFVGNCISYQSYLTTAPNPVLTIRTLNGKNILFTKTKFEEANIVIADRYVGNGVLHTVDLAVLPKLNGWDYMNSTSTSIQKTFLQTLNYIYFDPTRAVVTGIDPITGLPVYQPNTGYYQGNYFLNRSNVSNEDAKYTFVILTDAAYTAEKAKIGKYFTVTNPLNTAVRNTFMSDSITNWNIVKDLAFVGDFSASMPDTLISRDSVKIHLDPSAIVETHKVSNGVVYVMSRIDYKMSSKIRPIVIQGENYVGYLNSTGTRSTLTRRNPFTNVDFREVYFRTTNTASYWIKYQPTLYNAAYKVYWVAVRDFGTTGTPVLFPQRVAFGTSALIATLPYTNVTILNYNEVYAGTYTATSYGLLDTFLVGNTTTTDGTNSIVCDYIKLVPVLN